MSYDERAFDEHPSSEHLSGETMQAHPKEDLPRKLALPLDREVLATLRAGDMCLLSGELFTLRDAGHVRLLEEVAACAEAGDRGVDLPYGLSGQTIFYAGPTPERTGAQRPFGAIGPTTASRMDFAASELYDMGIVATIGKGARSAGVHDACVRNGAVYLVAIGGAAAYLAKCVISSEVMAYDDLGTEALRRVHVVDLPVFVGIDVLGNDVYSQALS